ncbi:hypothetical protein C2U70_23060 [Bradyrhizobium guangdongense]|nr:hypothetical protein C2U70_23060 [Bradyrhizobium guangdongense]
MPAVAGVALAAVLAVLLWLLLRRPWSADTSRPAVASSATPRKIGRSPAIWLTCLIALVAILALVNLVTDSRSNQIFGWDVRANCAAVDAYVGGLDPYFVKNLKGTEFSYPYLPVTLDVFRPLCATGFLLAHHMGVYLVLAVLCCVLLLRVATARLGPREAFLRVLFALGAFLGFEWAFLSANFAMFTGVLTAAALALLFRRSASEAADVGSFRLGLIGAAVLGLVASFKLVFCPVLAALYLLPQPRNRKVALIAVAAGAFVLPILVSMVFYADLFPSWLHLVTGQIPAQHSPVMEGQNPSLLFLARSFADHFGLAGRQLIVLSVYALAALALVLAPFALSVLRAVWDEASAGRGSPLQRLDQWLTAHPREANRIVLLAMYALYLSAPRLKEYAFFELAIYGAVLIADLPATALAAVLTVGIGIPTVSSLLGNSLAGSFGQLVAALVCFWVLLLDFRSRRQV